MVFSSTNVLVQASGCSRFHSSLTLTVCLAGCVGSGAGRRGAPPPQRQKPRPAATATRENSTPKTGNPIIKRLLTSQELQIKRLKNVIVELQNENETIKVENRTLKQVSPSFGVSQFWERKRYLLIAGVRGKNRPVSAAASQSLIRDSHTAARMFPIGTVRSGALEKMADVTSWPLTCVTTRGRHCNSKPLCV